MKTINALKVILLVLVVGFFSFASYNAGKSSIFSSEYNYYKKTEALLDSINNWNEPFMDTVMETDAYYEYEVAKEALK